MWFARLRSVVPAAVNRRQASRLRTAVSCEECSGSESPREQEQDVQNCYMTPSLLSVPTKHFPVPQRSCFVNSTNLRFRPAKNFRRCRICISARLSLECSRPRSSHPRYRHLYLPIPRASDPTGQARPPAPAAEHHRPQTTAPSASQKLRKPMAWRKTRAATATEHVSLFYTFIYYLFTTKIKNT